METLNLDAFEGPLRIFVSEYIDRKYWKITTQEEVDTLAAIFRAGNEIPPGGTNDAGQNMRSYIESETRRQLGFAVDLYNAPSVVGIRVTARNLLVQFLK